jgi:transposase-like protein
MEVRCRRCNSTNVQFKNSNLFFEYLGKNIKKFFCIDCGYEFEVIE